MSTEKKVEPGPVGDDVDLDTEDVRLADGTRLTEHLAEELAAETLARHGGRPSLTGDRRHTPRLTLRVTEGTRDALEEIAERQGRRLADVGRDAFDEYIDRHSSA